MHFLALLPRLFNYVSTYLHPNWHGLDANLPLHFFLVLFQAWNNDAASYSWRLNRDNVWFTLFRQFQIRSPRADGPIWSLKSCASSGIIQHHRVRYHLYTDDNQLYSSTSGRPNVLVKILFQYNEHIAPLLCWLHCQ